MIIYEKALSVILSKAKPLSQEHVPLESLHGHVLAKPVISKIDMPLFDNSAVDGYGVCISDLKNVTSNSPAKLNLLGAIYAGDKVNIVLKKGFAIKILTGALIPKGVEAVVMKEYCEERNGVVFVSRSIWLGENIRKKGEEFAKGQKVLEKGLYVTPPIVGLIASMGYDSFLCYRKPYISVIVTGSELVAPGKKLKPGKIYESNSYTISSGLSELGFDKHDVIVLKDDRALIKNQIFKALKKADVVITVGGISVGEKDFIKDVLEEISVQTFFTSIAMKPAKPNYFGVYAKNKISKLVFGLPGNPVSALLSFHQLIKPALFKLMGHNDFKSKQVNAELQDSLKKKAGRLEFVRGEAIRHKGVLSVKPTFGQGSHMLSGIAKANCLIRFPKDKEFIPKGENVTLELLNWNG